MAIIKRNRGTYRFQVRVRGSDGDWITRCFNTRREAEVFETEVKRRKQANTVVTNESRQITVNDYFVRWFESRDNQSSKGWQREQLHLYRTYVYPVLGELKLSAVTPHLVSEVLTFMAKLGKSPQTRLHAFNLLRKMFGDAIEMFQLLTYNPALKKLKPRVPIKEARHLNINQVKALLTYVVDKPNGLTIWLQLYLGFRIGELQALTWDDLDLETGTVFIRHCYVRKDGIFREYPKGGKQHSKRIPPELLDFLIKKRLESKSDFVVTNSEGGMIRYEHYFRTLRKYCKELEIAVIGTHGLRHSTSAVYMEHGASREDLRELFAHSSSKITDRYLHEKGTHLEKITNIIRLFPDKCSTRSTPQNQTRSKCSTNVPRKALFSDGQEDAVKISSSNQKGFSQ